MRCSDFSACVPNKPLVKNVLYGSQLVFALVAIHIVVDNYDITIGTPFVIYKERYAEREMLDYIRNARTGYTAQSLAEYNKLRKVMAIWDRYERSYTDETIKEYIKKMEKHPIA